MNILSLLFNTFFKIGLFTFGGGYAMIPLIKEYILKYSWASNDEIIEFIGISESTPGPFAINISTFIGYKNKGILGSIATTLGVILPSFIIILIIVKFYNKFKETYIVQYVLNNLKPIIIALLTYSIISIGEKILFLNRSINLINLLLFLFLLFINIKYKPSPVKLIFISGILGVLFLK